MEYFKTNEKQEVKDYPYGYLRTSAFFSLEFRAGKGFRSVFQTVNPKTGGLNKPKYSTYSPLMLMVREEDNGHVNYVYGHFNGAKEINRDSKTVFEHFDLFTPEQIKHFYTYLIFMLKVEIRALVSYCGADLEKVTPVLAPAINIAVEGIKTGSNLFDKVVINVEALDACKVPDFQPFRVVKYQEVTENKLNNPVVTQISDHDKRDGETLETIQAGENVKVLVKNTLGYYEVKNG